ncbi:oligosaccharide flippase family protein [Thomasclavelia spiroformis]|uniref:lipopolysaccharide biosynthesis protein n=1 Tax=Thomasclavelia spiroformis TaxID=29348 RepID=UPI002943E9FF|nr:oligosaccharide flippase family protein [Thomasclavelia spiroformis]
MNKNNQFGKNESRAKNAMLNLIFGYLSQIGIILLSFIGRKIFLIFLSADYLGINGLFSNILTVLSFAELGLDTALVYSLYKPVADNDCNMIFSLMKYFKKIYMILACLIFCIGIAIIPLFKYIVNSDLPLNYLIICYLLILINTVLSYFVAHKVALLSACQMQRIQKTVLLFTNIILQILYIIVLIIWKSYILYLCATIISTIIGNVILSVIFNRIIPDSYQNANIVMVDKKSIISRITSTFFYKIGAVLVSNTDNILISALVSTYAVGLYSNYYTVINSVQSFIAIMTTSLISGVGNLAVKKTRKVQHELFDMFLLIYHFIATVGFIGFYLVFNDFITLWLGKQFLFEKNIVLVIAMNFYLTNILNPIYIFREANGLFQQTKYVMLIRAFINLLLSYFLGIKFGVAGIFLATAVSLIITSFWYEPKLLFSKVMHDTVWHYYKKVIKYLSITIVSFIICCIVCGYFGEGFFALILKVICICCINVILFLGINLKTPEMEKIKTYIKRK